MNVRARFFVATDLECVHSCSYQDHLKEFCGISATDDDIKEATHSEVNIACLCQLAIKRRHQWTNQPSVISKQGEPGCTCLICLIWISRG